MQYRVKIMALGNWVNDYRKLPYDNLAKAQKRFDKITTEGRQASIVQSDGEVLVDSMEIGGYYADFPTKPPTF